jgi:hypothetical protein
MRAHERRKRSRPQHGDRAPCRSRRRNEPPHTLNSNWIIPAPLDPSLIQAITGSSTESSTSSTSANSADGSLLTSFNTLTRRPATRCDRKCWSNCRSVSARLKSAPVPPTRRLSHDAAVLTGSRVLRQCKYSGTPRRAKPRPATDSRGRASKVDMTKAHATIM